MSDEPAPTIAQLLLMAAKLHGLGPETDLDYANTVRVVDQVLRWIGLTTEDVENGWREFDCDPHHRVVYDALIELVHNGRAHSAIVLIEGEGNWGVPGDASRTACWPHYNSCRLTATGQDLARNLLDRHPAYRTAG